MVHAQALDLVQRDQHSRQEQLVLFLERKGEAVDDGAQDFEQLGDTIKTLGLIDELEEDIIDGPSNIRPQVQELAIDAM